MAEFSAAHRFGVSPALRNQSLRANHGGIDKAKGFHELQFVIHLWIRERKWLNTTRREKYMCKLKRAYRRD